MRALKQDILRIFPALTSQSRKGDNGVVGIIGGSSEYTGAPFYSAISALKAGADLVHIFCSKSAAGPIKAYSPEVIVHPLFVSSEELDQELSEGELAELQNQWIKKIADFYPRISSWVIGPGLGRDKHLKRFFTLFVESLPKATIIVFDADGLYFLCQCPEVIGKLRELKAVLTPNHRQFEHLKKLLSLPDFTVERQSEEIYSIAAKTECDCTLVKKGEYDHIISQNEQYVVQTSGGYKRCGGIGDILSGLVAACCFWNFQYGAVLACYITKLATRQAFELEGRSLTAPEVIRHIQTVVASLERGMAKKPNMRADWEA